MTDQRIQSGERVVGAGHATLADVANRFGLASHSIDGQHGRLMYHDFAGIIRVIRPSLSEARIQEYSRINNAQTVGAIKFGLAYNAAPVFRTVTAITRSGTTATATSTGHGYSNGNTILIQGANEVEYNGDLVISNVTTDTFDYTVSGSPATPATVPSGALMYASNGSWSRTVTGPCWLEKWLDDGGTKETWFAVSAAAGTAPVWQLYSRFDLINGLMLSPSRLYHAQKTQVSVTGTTAEVSVYSTTVKGNSLGKLGEILATVVGSYSGAGGTKTFRLKYGGVTIATGVQSGAGTLTCTVGIRNRNATNAQYSYPQAGSLLSVSSPTSSIDTTADKTLEVTIQLANSGDTASVEIVNTEVIYKAW